MRHKLYAREFLKKLVKKRELEILETIWDEELSVDQKIQALLEE